jgi:hypothetical protein
MGSKFTSQHNGRTQDEDVSGQAAETDTWTYERGNNQKKIKLYTREWQNMWQN